MQQQLARVTSACTAFSACVSPGACTPPTVPGGKCKTVLQQAVAAGNWASLCVTRCFCQWQHAAWDAQGAESSYVTLSLTTHARLTSTHCACLLPLPAPGTHRASTTTLCSCTHLQLVAQVHCRGYYSWQQPHVCLRAHWRPFATAAGLPAVHLLITAGEGLAFGCARGQLGLRGLRRPGAVSAWACGCCCSMWWLSSLQVSCVDAHSHVQLLLPGQANCTQPRPTACNTFQVCCCCCCCCCCLQLCGVCHHQAALLRGLAGIMAVQGQRRQQLGEWVWRAAPSRLAQVVYSQEAVQVCLLSPNTQHR
jgi:hypothetical protein